jgi:sugar/nucleoside kinase (ribokinase family)
LRVLVAGFVTIDTIQLPVREVVSVGGPPSYAGLVCSRFGYDVKPLTKVGNDFPDEQAIWLARNGVALSQGDRSRAKPTTRFRIIRSEGERTLTMLSRCEDISPTQIPPDMRFDASLISPVAGEVSSLLLTEVSARSDFTFLDPQGFVRAFDEAGRVTPKPLADRSIISKVDAVKMDRSEAESITGRTDPVDALRRVAAMGPRKGMVTQGGDASFVLDGSKIYRIEVPKSQVVDTTGAGDVLGGATISWYLRTRDFLRSACFGLAASSLSLNMIALGKVDLPMSVDESAMRLFSLASPVAAL